MSGRRFLLLPLAALALALPGCREDEPETPAACLGPAADYLQALRAAPDPVRLPGDTPISECLVRGQEGGELSGAGESIVTAATKLNEAARLDSAGPETVRLGYLVGAVQQGASETGGIHADLVRRVDSAARFSPDGLLPPEFERAYGTGYAAGQRDG
jgi:hypothetical protein